MMELIIYRVFEVLVCFAFLYGLKKIKRLCLRYA